MGCGSSSDTTGTVPGGRNYHASHKGLKPPGYGHKLDPANDINIIDPDPNDTTTLQVVSVDLLIKENTYGHHTDEYDVTTGENPKLVIRRGQCFDVSLKFNRPYNNQDDLRLVFEFGENPLPHKATKVEIVVSDKDEPLSWGAKIVHTQENEVIVRLITPPTLFIGIWKFNVDIIKKDGDEDKIYRYKREHPIYIYILFNPWCKDDQVYHANSELLEEYVLNENGQIYRGSKNDIKGKPWYFGQFETVVMDCAMYLLDSLSQIPPTSRGDPVVIARKISAIANSQDDSGVLSGNWSGTYTGGISPLEWSGSAAILKKFYETKKPVKFGQCWVFSGVVTTLCRAIGIPARSVTNFSSAHDCDGSITIDCYIDPEGEKLPYMNRDSIWNFHVWNDVWMGRPDLPKEYKDCAWQVIDATPQEKSDGVFCCGPVPLLAIKNGDVNLPYDGPFIYAEVNSDRAIWLVEGYGKPHKLTRLEKNRVGKNISSKAPGRETGSREDVTNEYKFKEGTKAERSSVITANMKGSNRHDIYDEEKPGDVTFELIVPEHSPYGGDYEVGFKARNESKETRTVFGHIKTCSLQYTGVEYATIKKEKVPSKVIGPGESAEFKMNVSFAEYENNLTDDCHLNVTCTALVDETKQVDTEDDNFQLVKPTPKIECPDKGTVGEPFDATFSFKNPLPKTLTNCQLVIEGPGIKVVKTMKLPDVPAHEEIKTSIQFTPVKKGKKDVIISFFSREIEDVGTDHLMTIQAKPE